MPPGDDTITRHTLTIMAGENDHLHKDRTLRRTVVNIDGQGTLSIGGGGGTGVVLTVNDTSAINLAAGALLVGDAVANAGHVALDGGFIDLRALTNSGLLSSTGAASTLSAGLFINTGTIDVAGLLTIGPVTGAEAQHETFVNTGRVTIADGGTLALAGTVATASLAGIHETGNGQLALNGLVQNPGATLTAGAGHPIQRLDIGGTILGGAVDFSAQAVRYTDARLNGVTITGTVDLFTKYASATLLGAWNLASTGTVAVTGLGATLTMAGSATLDAGTLLLGTLTNGRPTPPALHLEGVNTTLTLGAGLTFTGMDSGTIGGRGATLINNGSFSWGHTQYDSGVASLIGVSLVNNGQFTLSNFLDFFAPHLTNTGTITINQGDFRCDTFYNSRIGSFANSGAVILNGGSLEAGNWTNTGTVVLNQDSNGYYSSLTIGNTTLADLKRVDNSHGGTVTIRGMFDNTGNTLRAGPGTQLGTLALSGTTIGGTIVGSSTGLLIGGTLENLTYQGTLNENYGNQFGVSGTLTMQGTDGSGRGTIQLGSNCYIYGGAHAADTITNAVISMDGANIFPGTDPLTFASSDTISMDGTYSQFGGQGVPYGTVISDGTVTVASTAVSTSILTNRFVNNGTFALNGTTLELGGGIFTNTGLFAIDGAAASVANGYGRFMLITNTGTITLNGGSISQNTANGVGLLNGGTGQISGFGTLTEAILNNGNINATGGTLSITQLLAGHGTLDISSGSTLLLTAGNLGNSAAFLGSNATFGLEPMQFSGTIEGYAPTDTITLLATNATSASFVGNTIVVDLSAGGSLTLDTSTALTGNIAVTHDTQGDSLLTYTAGNGTNVTFSSHAMPEATTAVLHEPTPDRSFEWFHGSLAGHAVA